MASAHARTSSFEESRKVNKSAKMEPSSSSCALKSAWAVSDCMTFSACTWISWCTCFVGPALAVPGARASRSNVKRMSQSITWRRFLLAAERVRRMVIAAYTRLGETLAAPSPSADGSCSITALAAGMICASIMREHDGSVSHSFVAHSAASMRICSGSSGDVSSATSGPAISFSASSAQKVPASLSQSANWRSVETQSDRVAQSGST
mmetsp:Transcript_35102/g.85317  ORF Transcript_35102/g.85317 Transcript_35102/m.85317 type:complete len:208 (-) Transcript_35102:273-896(-)